MIAAYTGVFLMIISIVAVGYQAPQKVEPAANVVTVPSTAESLASDQPSVDQLVATNIAAGIAERADMPIARNVANLSVSLTVRNELVQSTDSAVITKPQIIQPMSSGHDFKSYTTQAGDNAQTVAAKYGITATTLKWANDLPTDAIEINRTLTIPPVDGVVYTVKSGDTAGSIAGKYQASENRIISFNNLEISGVSEGQRIMVPAGQLPETERPGYVAPRAATSQGNYGGGYSTVNSQIAKASAGNRYAFGNCTWYAYERRAQLGRPVGSFWGNGGSWGYSGSAAGFRVDRNPESGAVLVQAGSPGHVAIVESVNSDGSLTISEMNYAGNFNRVTSRTIPAGQVGMYSYVH